ncbi:mitochondrial import inner membrane translocase subunit TIM17 protein, partial [Toxoplasma gondii p89]
SDSGWTVRIRSRSQARRQHSSPAPQRDPQRLQRLRTQGRRSAWHDHSLLLLLQQPPRPVSRRRTDECADRRSSCGSAVQVHGVLEGLGCLLSHSFPGVRWNRPVPSQVRL